MEPTRDASIRFLVVDDQFNVRRMVFNFLRTFGYNKMEDASDGEEAWAKLTMKHFDFIICDWNMPNMSGLELLKKVRADSHMANIPFLMVTAEVVEEIVAEAIEEGVDGYILKPFKAQTLMERIDHTLEKRSKPSPAAQALEKGLQDLNQGNPALALEAFEEALALMPKSPRILLAAGEALEALEKEEEALGKYNQALDLSERFVKAHDKLASLYKKRGETEKATSHLRKAAKISPRNAQRQLSLGKALLEQGDVEEALKALNQAQTAAAKDVRLMNEVGETLLAAGLNEQAATAFNKSLDIDPQRVHAYNRLGIAHRRQKQYDQAIDVYQRAIKVVPDDENLYYNLAVALIEGKYMPQAKEALRQALKVNPEFAEAMALLKKLP